MLSTPSLMAWLNTQIDPILPTYANISARAMIGHPSYPLSASHLTQPDIPRQVVLLSLYSVADNPTSLLIFPQPRHHPSLQGKGHGFLHTFNIFLTSTLGFKIPWRPHGNPKNCNLTSGAAQRLFKLGISYTTPGHTPAPNFKSFNNLFKAPLQSREAD